jgi:hypothetical protein
MGVTYRKFNRPHCCGICGVAGHRRDTCPKAVRKSMKRVSQLDKKTRYTTSVPERLPALKDLKQIGYPEILRMSECKVKTKLRELGLLPKLHGRRCFCCGGKMTPQKSLGPFAFRCRTRACDTMLRRADLAFTPLWHLQKGGQLQYAAYLSVVAQTRRP